MNDLERMKTFYSNRKSDAWSVFNCYPFFLDCKQTWMMTKILNGVNNLDFIYHISRLTALLPDIGNWFCFMTLILV